MNLEPHHTFAAIAALCLAGFGWAADEPTAPTNGQPGTRVVDNGVRAVTIGTDQFAALRRLWSGGKEGGGASSRPVVQTIIDFNAAEGTYELKRVELGLFGEHVWLMHQQPETDEESGSIGILFQKEW
jgi:hypothetical protein